MTPHFLFSPRSFFDRIYTYHRRKLDSAWDTAHDVGAGAGIVSATLATTFTTVLVSDPNEGYTALARKILVDESHFPASKLRFLQEGAEHSSAASGTVDLVAACEMIQWTDTEVAVEEFRRQLKVGGTLAVTSYTKPRIVGNQEAQGVWREIFDAYSARTRGLGFLYDRAFQVMNTGLESVAFPVDRWGDVQRVYINSDGDLEAFKLDERVTESRVEEGEEKIWEEGDDDWADSKGIDWFKAYFGTWVPRIPETEIQHLWDALEVALRGESAAIQTPIVMILATRKT